jgi:hypothetical protein
MADSEICLDFAVIKHRRAHSAKNTKCAGAHADASIAPLSRSSLPNKLYVAPGRDINAPGI